jgi:hypothetical protein
MLGAVPLVLMRLHGVVIIKYRGNLCYKYEAEMYPGVFKSNLRSVFTNKMYSQYFGANFYSGGVEKISNY